MARSFPSRAAAMSLAFTLAVGLGASSCAQEDEPSSASSDLTEAVGEVEVILTNPYCDVCSQADKAVLLERSQIIAKVIELIDGATHRIDAAQYTFSRKQIAEALVRAQERGVDVRIAMDAGQDRSGSVARSLKDDGVPVRFVTGHDLGGRAGLQHAKFMIVDETNLLTGSNNWSSTGTSINNENTIVMTLPQTDPRMAGFSCHFEKIWEGSWQNAGECSNETAAFTPSSKPFKMIRQALRDSEHSVDVLMHHLSYKKLVKELAKAAERGVEVRVVLNAETRQEHTGSQWTRLLNAGGRIRYKQTNAETYQLMHHKLVIIDDKIMINGSGNWSGSAFFKNFENFVRYDDPRIMQPFREGFHRLWNWSLGAEALDGGLTAMEQHASATQTYFGNLHAHVYAEQDGHLMDDGHAYRRDEAGEEVPVGLPAGVGPVTKYAFEYARDQAGLDFMALTPHTKDERAEDGADQANMSQSGFDELRESAQAVTESSGGAFLAIAGMEWSTNSTGNHVNVIGSEAIAKSERGRFDELYTEFLPERAFAGDRPLIMLNHPKTFRLPDSTELKGSYDQIFGINLLEIPKSGERKKKFNDFGLDDFAPMMDVLPSWIDGTAEPDPATVDATMLNMNRAMAPYARLMEVTLNRGNEFGTESPQNPSIVPDDEVLGTTKRRTKVGDWAYYLTQGFRLAPAASHDNHMANWGAGHTSRTAVVAERLRQAELLSAIEQREVFASEDQNLEMRFYAQGRVPMGSATATADASATGHLWLTDPDYAGEIVVTLYRGTVGNREVEAVSEQTIEAGGWLELSLDLPEVATHFFYVEVLETGVDRAAWSAPIWIERLQ